MYVESLRKYPYDEDVQFQNGLAFREICANCQHFLCQDGPKFYDGRFSFWGFRPNMPVYKVWHVRRRRK